MTTDQILKAFNKVGISIEIEQATQFVQYYELLIEWNKKMNLTAITDENEVIEKHFIDSVLALKVYDFKAAESLIDIGTGAGFPGIPLKILFPHLEVALVDALNKRLNFLNVVIEQLSLDSIETIHGRAEDLAKTEMRENYDICVSRAVSQLNVLCEYCLPFINLNGIFISYKGMKTMEELEDSHNAIEILGAEVVEVNDKVKLNDGIERGFVIMKKIKETPSKYPRRAGKPLKKPL